MACWGQCEGNIGLRLSELLQVYTVAMHNAEIVCTVRIDYKFSEQIT